MPSFRTGTVTALISERPGLQRVEVDGERTYVLTQLVGSVAVGDRVVINTTAVELALGTGGWHFVHWNLEREQWSQSGRGHIMKLRYTSLQVDSGAAEERGGASAGSLSRTPVVACALHSQVPVVAAAVAATRPATRVAYVMTDGGALPLVLSDTVAALLERGLLHTTVSAGQAFGGQHEAVNVPSALAVAAGDGAEVIVVATGPGVVGTGTALGFSAMEVASTVDSAERMGGIPIVALRYSDADPRDRHRGVSHHSTTALSFAYARALVPVPAAVDPPELGGHQVVPVPVPDAGPMLDRHGLRVTTMGRGPEDDPGFFAHAAAAGVVAGHLVDDPGRYPRPS
jgi:hypothetical protein